MCSKYVVYNVLNYINLPLCSDLKNSLAADLHLHDILSVQSKPLVNKTTELDFKIHTKLKSTISNNAVKYVLLTSAILIPTAKSKAEKPSCCLQSSTTGAKTK